MQKETDRSHAAREKGRLLRMATLDLIDSFAVVPTQEMLIDQLEKAFTGFGIDHFVITGLPNPHERFEKVVILRHWPTGWFQLYAKEDYVRSDPVIRKCRLTTSPFEWSEAPFDVDREPRALEIMNRARDFGMPRGFSLPIHGINGYEACFSVSGKTPDFDSSTKPVLHLMAMYAFERARQLAMPEQPERRNPLTAREREVLTWAAVGKSGKDIAEIMSIAERTVIAHTVNAAAKLGAANKTQAVVLALKDKYIKL